MKPRRSSPVPADLFDPGLQPERTALAWRRTALSAAAAGLLALGHGLEVLGLVGAAVVTAPGFAFVATAAVGATRYRRITSSLQNKGHLLGTGVATVLVAAAVALFGALLLGAAVDTALSEATSWLRQS